MVDVDLTVGQGDRAGEARREGDAVSIGGRGGRVAKRTGVRDWRGAVGRVRCSIIEGVDHERRRRSARPHTEGKQSCR